MTNHKQIIGAIKETSVLGLSDLVKTAEEEFGVTAAAPVAVAGVAGGADTVAEKIEFDVEPTSTGSSKIKIIKAVKETAGLKLKDTRELVGGAPRIIKEALPKEEAEKLKEQLEEVGATVELK